MELPALLPEELRYAAVAQNDSALFELLVKNPQDLVHYFQYACDDETWSGDHAAFMQEVMQWLTNRFFQDSLSLELAQTAIRAIRAHHPILQALIPLNLTFKLKEGERQENSLLWGASSEYFRNLIREECRDRAAEKLEIVDCPLHVFKVIEEFVFTGAVKDLWRKSQHEIIEVLRKASEWSITALENLCQDLLTRYIERSNAVEYLLQAHEEKWSRLRDACIDFINALDVGVKFEKTNDATFSFEFTNFQADALEIFENAHLYITKLRCGGSLPELPPFSDVINRCPHLVCLDLSETRTYSDRFLDIPRALEELNLSKCPWLAGKLLKKFSEICPHLRALGLGSNGQLRYTDWGILKNFKSLEKIDISRCYQVKDDEFKLVLQACRGVTHFKLSECTGLSDHSFFQLGQHIPNLTDLDISRCLLSDAGLVDLSMRCKRLTVLDLTRCKNISEKGILEALNNLSLLRKIIVAKCPVDSSIFGKIKAIRPFVDVVY